MKNKIFQFIMSEKFGLKPNKNEEEILIAKRFTILLITCIILSFISCTTKPDIGMSIKVTNNTSEIFVAGYIRVSETASWSDNLLTSNIQSGSSMNLKLPSSIVAGNHLIEMRSKSGICYTKINIPIQINSNEKLIFTNNDISNKAIQIVNNTGFTTSHFSSTHASYPFFDYISLALNDGESKLIGLSGYPTISDTMLRTENGIRFIKRDIPLKIGMNNDLVFTYNDLSNIIVSITNNTGESLTRVVYFRRSGTQYLMEGITWGSLNNGETSIMGIAETYIPNNYDVQVRSLENICYTKENVPLVIGNNANLIFTNTDIGE